MKIWAFACYIIHQIINSVINIYMLRYMNLCIIIYLKIIIISTRNKYFDVNYLRYIMAMRYEITYDIILY